MDWFIAADSSCDLFPSQFSDQGFGINPAEEAGAPVIEDAPSIGFDTVPFVMRVGETDFVDDENLDVDAMLTAMENESEVSTTACPSPQAWVDLFQKSDQVVAITISERLSGSFESASVAKNMVLADHPDKKIAVINSCSTGPEVALCIDLMAKCICMGDSFDEVVAKAQAFVDETRTVFSLSSFNNLVKNGRIPKLVGFLAGKLGVWGIGIGSDKGEIILKGKARGAAKCIKIILEDMFSRGYNGGRVLISHSLNPDFAQRVASAIKEHWSTAKVDIIPCRGLDAFYAERGGVIIGY